MRLQHVNAVITGASSGIGQAVTSHFRREAFVAELGAKAADRWRTVDVVGLPVDGGHTAF